MHEFLSAHQAELIELCVSKLRSHAPLSSDAELKGELPRILKDMIETMRAEAGMPATPAWEDLSAAAAQLGRDGQRRGRNIGLVSLSLGVISASTGELGGKLGLSFAAGDYKTFNECIDAGVAAAVSEYSEVTEESRDQADAKRLGFFAHELRNSLSTAIMAFELLREGQLGLKGLTGDVLRRSLYGMRSLLAQSLVAATTQGGAPLILTRIDLKELLVRLKSEATLERGIAIEASAEDGLVVETDERLLVSAITNLLQNAIKFTHADGLVQLRAFAVDEQLLTVEVRDECGGLTQNTEDLFKPFVSGDDRRSTGLGLAITKQGISALGGEIVVDNYPGVGCSFAIKLSRPS